MSSSDAKLPKSYYLLLMMWYVVGRRLPRSLEVYKYMSMEVREERVDGEWRVEESGGAWRKS